MSPSRQVRRALVRVRTVAVALALAVLPTRAAVGQSRTLTACTPDALSICAELRFSQVSGGLFELGLRTIGSTGDPLLPVAFYNLVLGTGAPTAASPVTSDVAPTALGGASISDSSPWEVFDAGDALFLSALTNRGVGGCAAGPDIDGFGQAATTCGAGRFTAFTFAPTAVFDPDRFQILDLEAVALTSPTQGASCGAPGTACHITADTRVSSTPEPGGIVLLASGLAVIVSVGARRRHGRA